MSTAGPDGHEAELARLLERVRAAGRIQALLPLVRSFLAGSAQAPGVAPELPGRHGMVGSSPRMLAVFDLIEKAAPSSIPVLVQGETGTGKERVARALHELSPRRAARFVAENCASLPAGLLESELFGHVRGSFTGAIADREGHFALAHGGTLFLDEIGDMPLEMQSKLLRVLEEGEVRPVGSNRMQKVDVRVVAATHHDLATRVRERLFREDLYYRLGVVRIDLPPLRERPGDVVHLVQAFVRRFGPPGARVTPAALARLEAASWPGNVRQLENEVRRALALSGAVIDAADLALSG
jgi:transcriptional regulator with GAF, ATPase, and Fis domain